MQNVSIFLLNPPAGLDTNEVNLALSDPDHPRHDEAEFWFARSFRGPYDPRLNYQHAISYERAGSDLSICEDAFYECNVGTGALAMEYRANGNRSLSVGDVVTVNDRAYFCAPTGWSELTNFERVKHEAA